MRTFGWWEGGPDDVEAHDYCLLECFNNSEGVVKWREKCRARRRLPGFRVYTGWDRSRSERRWTRNKCHFTAEEMLGVSDIALTLCK
jgi:hypothetical protein